MTVSEFRKQWSHKPTPIPQDASGLWYSEECTEQLMAAFAESERSSAIKEAVKIVESYQCSEIENRKDVRPLTRMIAKAIRARGER